MSPRITVPLWRLAAVLPPGRIHERHARRELGMPGRHPERVTRMPSRRDQDLLGALQLSAWPLNEWADILLIPGRCPVNPSDFAIAAMLITSLANTGAILLGLRTVAKQLRIAAPPKETQGGPAQPPAGSAGAQ